MRQQIIAWNTPVSYTHLYFDSALSSDCFLGFEELGELGDHAEPPEKAD